MKTDKEREKSKGSDRYSERSRSRDSDDTAIEIELEFCHTAVLKDKPVVQQSGITHTHDWHLHVKALDGGKCENYLDKVVFVLHGTYKNPMRNVKAPPFEMKESGYGSFTIPIDLFFKSPNAHFRKTRVNYELVLQPNKDIVPPTDPAYQHQIKMCRREKLAFPGTVDEGFRRRLLRGGGKPVDLPAIRKDRVTVRKDREEESSKDRSRYKGREIKREKSKEMDRPREIEREKSKERNRLRDRSRDREKSKERNILRDRSRDREKSKERDRHKDRSRERDREWRREDNRNVVVPLNICNIRREKEEDKLAKDSLSKSEETSGQIRTTNSLSCSESENIEEKGVHWEEKSDEDEKSLVRMDKVGSEKELDINEEADYGGIKSNKRNNIAMESQANTRSKLETYCLLCQEDGHVLNDDCVVNAICLRCGVKGHVRRDCYCLLCQEYGHVLNDDCTSCFNCGTKGHVRRDCPAILDDNLQIHHEIGLREDAMVPTNGHTDSTDAISSSTDTVIENPNDEDKSLH